MPVFIALWYFFGDPEIKYAVQTNVLIDEAKFIRNMKRIIGRAFILTESSLILGYLKMAQSNGTVLRKLRSLQKSSMISKRLSGLTYLQTSSGNK